MTNYTTYIVNKITQPPILQGSNAFSLKDGGILYGKFNLETQQQLQMFNVYDHDNKRMTEALNTCDCNELCKVKDNVIKTNGFFGDIEIEFIKEDLSDLKEDVQNIKHNVSTLNFKLNEITAYVKNLITKDDK